MQYPIYNHRPSIVVFPVCFLELMILIIRKAELLSIIVIVYVIAEFGDYDPLQHGQDYLDGLVFAPEQVRNCFTLKK